MSETVRIAQVGDDVRVVSGPHEGRSGRIVQIKNPEDDMIINGSRLSGLISERYAVVEYAEQNCFNETNVDHIAVPVRRLAPVR